ncbi:putative adipose-regulatory protein-domain-containing protein [Protomyces lactucae-debilis]|uniref:Putative adipose-regulatory protein-domain-containing protein n=1 Tax=Protomyces lactucae-debilis TaxID=2754530 RepID=A0A1Y2FWS7_PROLT|nr:putative adipose-regulatory protein-domain-containing protein [Protomyces lactucae-debilis]ORY87987.1 putative adipose-regulatory protein-domain-containing protein [Protomyces lactucae-debilis]
MRTTKLQVEQQESPDNTTTQTIRINQVGRGVLNISLFASTAVALLFVSCIAFLVFYFQTVPTQGVVEEVYLQYHQGSHPFASVDLDFSSGNGLVTGQAYDVSIELIVPTSQVNKDLGNFMVDLSLVEAGSEQSVTASRPAILRYASPFVSRLQTVAGAGPVVLGIKKETEVLHVPLLEAFSFESTWLANAATAEIQIQATRPLQVYRCRLHFTSKLTGLVWFLRRFRVLSFIVFTMLFYISALAFTLGTWTVLAFISGNGNAASQDKGKRSWDQGKGAPGSLASSMDSSRATTPEPEEVVDYTAGFPRGLPASVIAQSERSATTASTGGFFKFEEGTRGSSGRARRRSKGKKVARSVESTAPTSVGSVRVKEESLSDGSG